MSHCEGTNFKRFLITGREDNVYSPLSHNQSILLDNDDTYHIKGEIGTRLEINSLNNLKKTADGTKRALNVIKEVYLEGTYIHKEYLFYSLAKLIHGNSPKKTYNPYQDARNFVLEVCPKKAVHDLKKFYIFLKAEAECRIRKLPKHEKSGWKNPQNAFGWQKSSRLFVPGCAGRGIRRIIGLWYNRQNPYDVTFCKNKAFYSHRNIIRKSHIRGSDTEHKVMLTYLTKGLKVTEKQYSENGEALSLIEMYRLKEKLKLSTDLQEVLRMIRTHQFCDLQLIPTSCHKHPKIWSALLNFMPMSDVYCNLKLLSFRALITDDEDEVAMKLVENLTDQPALKHSKLQPAMILIALRNCQKRWKPPPKVKKSRVSATICNSVLNAIESMIQPSFDNLPKLQKSRNVLIHVDVRTEMLENSCCWKNSNVTCLDAMAITILSLLNSASDPINEVKVCTIIKEHGEKQIMHLDFMPSMTVKDVKSKLKTYNEYDGKSKYSDRNIKLDVTLPIRCSLKSNTNFDTFMFISGTHTYCSKDKLSYDLSAYRSSINSKAKFLMAAFGCKHDNSADQSTIANEDEAFMFKIAGFDGNVPKLMIKYINEEF